MAAAFLLFAVRASQQVLHYENLGFTPRPVKIPWLTWTNLWIFASPDVKSIRGYQLLSRLGGLLILLKFIMFPLPLHPRFSSATILFPVRYRARFDPNCWFSGLTWKKAANKWHVVLPSWSHLGTPSFVHRRSCKKKFLSQGMDGGFFWSESSSSPFIDFSMASFFLGFGLSYEWNMDTDNIF